MTDEANEKVILKFLKREKLMNGVTLRVDPENAIVQVVEKIGKDNDHIQIERTPKKSKGSNGAVERYHQSIQGLTRTWKSVIMQKCNIKGVNSDFKLVPWMVEFASWSHDKVQKKVETGLTGYQARTGRPYTSELCSFGETAMVREPGDNRQKMRLNWAKGIWLGREDGSDEHVVGTASGVNEYRTIRRFPEDGRYQKTVLEEMRGLPWDRKGTQKGSEPMPTAVPGAASGMVGFRAMTKTPNCKGCDQPHPIPPHSGLPGATPKVLPRTPPGRERKRG